VGVAALVAFHPTAAYTNDAYRGGASFGFVIRYVVFGVAGGLLLHAIRLRPLLAGIGLAVVLGLAILPVALDTETESERRRAAATAEKDPARREAADFKAGMIDGCVNRTRREAQGTPDEGLNADSYCVCFIGALTAGREDIDQMRAAVQEIETRGLSPELERAQIRCLEQARAD
jgi:hypothetical protein